MSSTAIATQFYPTLIRKKGYSHPLTAKAGTKAWTAREQLMKTNENTEISWKSYKIDGDRLAVRCLQVFFDKPQASLSADALQFYPLQLTLPHFSENLC